MSQAVDLERSWTFFDASGTKYWSGVLITGQTRFIYNAEASATIAAGEAVIASAATTSWPHWDRAASSEPVKGWQSGVRVAAVASVAYIGVALENIPAGKEGRVGGRGYQVSAKSLTAASLTSNTVGAAATGSATAGSLDAVATEILQGRTLGIVLMPAGVTIPSQSGSLVYIGVDVNPH